MDQPVNPDERDPSVTTVAAISLVAGLACTVAPATTARHAGIDATPGVVRAVGLADLAPALGLYVGRPSWPWLLARAASNPAIAALSLASVRSRRARLLAASLAVATGSDLRTVARLSAPPIADRHATQRPSALVLRVLIDTQPCHRMCDGQEWRDTGTRKLIGRRCLRPIGRSQGRSRNSSRRSLEPVVIAEGARATCAPTDRRDLTVP
jgi:hypothetical protein